MPIAPYIYNTAYSFVPANTAGTSASVGNSAYITALPANIARSGFLIQNTHASQTLTVAFGASGNEIPMRTLAAGAVVTQDDIGNFQGEIRVVGSGASTTFIANDYVPANAFSDDADTIYNRILSDASGFTMTSAQRVELSQKIDNINSILGAAPLMWYDANLSCSSTTSATKVFNLGSLGSGGDASFTNGTVSNMVASISTNKKKHFVFNGSNQDILSANTTNYTNLFVFFFVKTNNAGAAAMGTFTKASTGASNQDLGFFAATNRAAVFTSATGNFNTLGTYANVDATYEGWAYNLTGTSGTIGKNGGNGVSGSVSTRTTSTANAWRFGREFNLLNGNMQHIILTNTNPTQAQITALYNLLKTDVGLT